MRDEAVARFAEKRGIVVHALEQRGPDESVPRCGDDSGTYTLSSAARADVTCEPCQVGLPERKGCGRVDDHDDHPWRRNQVLIAGELRPAVGYWCPGTPIVEGGQRA